MLGLVFRKRSSMDLQNLGNDDVKTPISRFKKLNDVKSGSFSPFLDMPASPFLHRLGYGTGVSVYLVERSPRHGRHRSPWAIKKVNKRNDDGDECSKRLKEEAKILKILNHQNIVGFRGLTHAKDGMLCLALEDAEKSLFDIIENCMEKDLGPLPSPNIMRVAFDIANALAYLHGEKNMLHGDMKSGNILIKGDFAIAKLCDFGVSIKLDENMMAPSLNYVGTDSWSSKEALNKSGFVTDKSDVYSYGLVIYEMLTLTIPHFDIFPDEDDFDTEGEFEAAFQAAEMRMGSYLGTRPLLPQRNFDKSYENAIALFYTCSDEDSKNRPSSKQIAECLQSSTIAEVDDVQCKLSFE